MSAAESEESRCPDLATASIRTQSIRSTVAHRSSSAIRGFASIRSASFGGGLGSGTGVRCLTAARLALLATNGASVWPRMDGTVRANCRKLRSRTSDDHEGPEHVADRGRAAGRGASGADDGVQAERPGSGGEEALQAHLIPSRHHESLRPEVPWRQGARDLAGSKQPLPRDEPVIRLVFDE